MLIEAGGRVQLQGKLVVARQAGQHVTLRSFEVDPVSLHAGQLAFMVSLNKFQAQTNALQSGRMVKGIVANLTVVVGIRIFHRHLI